MDYNAEQDWQEAQRLLQEAQRQQQSAPSQQPNTWQQAADVIQRMQQPTTPRAPIKDEPAPQPDDTKAYWAMALSVLGNNGRDLGAILSQNAQNYNQRLSAWEQRNSPDAKLDRQLKQIQLARADREPQREAFQQTAQLAGIMQGEQNAAEQRRQFDARQGQDLLLKQADAVQQRAMAEYQQQGLDKRQAEQLAHEKWAAHLSQNGMDVRQATEIKAQQERDAARFKFEQEQQDRMIQGQLAGKLMEQQGKLPAPIPGTSFNGPEGQRRYMTLTPGQREQVDKDIITGREVNLKLQQLHSLMLAPPSAANENTYNSAINFLIGDQSKEGSTGILSNPEYIRYIKNLPKYGSVASLYGRYAAQVTSPRALVEVLRGQNPGLQTLEQLQNNFADMARTRAQVYGINDDELQTFSQPGSGQQAAGAQKPFDPVALKLPGRFVPADGGDAAPTPPPGNTGGVTGFWGQAADRLNRGATGSWAAPDDGSSMPPPNVPAQKQAAQLPTMISPDGRQIVQPMSAQEAAQRIAQGWRYSNG